MREALAVGFTLLLVHRFGLHNSVAAFSFAVELDSIAVLAAICFPFLVASLL